MFFRGFAPSFCVVFEAIEPASKAQMASWVAICSADA